MTEKAPRSSVFSKAALIVSIAIGIVLISSSVAFYLVFVKAPTDLAHNTATGIKEFFNFTPRVKVNQTVVIEQNTPILEVATVSRELYIDYSWSHTWLGSTKTIQLQGSFVAKAGFDLREPFDLDVERNPLRVEALMSPPKLLSLQMDTYRIVKDESGWWNRISDGDRETAVRELQEVARSRAEASGILDEARSTIELRIREIVERNGATVQFSYNRNLKE
jgi:hypothetical protein